MSQSSTPIINRKYFLLIIYILYVEFWNLRAFTFLSKDAWTIVTLSILIFGQLYYRSISHRKSLLNANNSKPIIFIFIGLFLSMIMAYFFYGQSFLVSLLAYKRQYLMIGGFILLSIAPKISEIVGALKIYGILFSFIYILRLLFPHAFVLPETADPNEISAILGYEILPILLFLYLQQFKTSPSFKNIIKVTWIFLLLALMQNRTTLIPVVLCCGYIFLKVESKYRFLIIVILSSVIITLITSSASIWMGMINETQMQLSNPNYNRILALNYFLFDANSSILTAIFGNGLLSYSTTSLMQQLMSRGIYNSDMGFIGYWNQFGIIPIIVFYKLIYKTLRYKFYPLFIKCYAIFVLFGSFTIMYFGQPSKIICFLLFFYIMTLYTLGEKQNNNLNIKYLLN